MDKFKEVDAHGNFPMPSANGPYIGRKGFPVYFKASVTGGSKPYKFYWEFGDGERSTLQNTQHTYAASGNFVVSLKVIDGKGKSKRVYTAAIIESAGITVDLGPEISVEAGAPVRFRARLSDRGKPEFYVFSWNFEDGSPPQEGTNRITHVFNTPGEYVVSVTVSDDEGTFGSASVKVTVHQKTHSVMIDDPLGNDTLDKYSKEDGQQPPAPKNEPAATIIPDPEIDTRQTPQEKAEPNLMTNEILQQILSQMIPLSKKTFCVTPGVFETIAIDSPEPAYPEGAPPLKTKHKIKVWGPFK